MEIQLKNITKTYDGEVLKGISLTICQGDYISITGRSGSGKTTLLKIIGLLEQPTEGEVIIDGIKSADLWKDELADIRRQKIGFIFQDYFLLENLSALDNILLPGLLEKQEGSRVKSRAYKLSQYLEIEEKLLKKYPKELSGGEKQRIAIVRALMNDPDILLADEPTGNLDEKNQEKVQSILKRLHEKERKTILLVTHDMEFAKTSKKHYCNDSRRDGASCRIFCPLATMVSKSGQAKFEYRPIPLRNSPDILLKRPHRRFCTYHIMLYDRISEPCRIRCDLPSH